MLAQFAFGTQFHCPNVDHPAWVYKGAFLNPELNDSNEVFEVYLQYAVAFFKTTLSNDKRYTPYLTQGYADKNEPLVDEVKNAGPDEE